jgi:hypothetical protein
MIINHNNFEAYILDYLEGNLDSLLTADLMAFLAENPEFEKYLPDYDERISISDTLEFGYKELLKKNLSDIPAITSENFDEFCIACCEGLLNAGEMNRLTEYISRHPDRQNDLDIFRKLALQPDTFILFTGKQKLKKLQVTPNKLRYLYYAVGVAASIALMIMLAIRKPAVTVNSDTLPNISGSHEYTGQPVPSVSPGDVFIIKQVKAPPGNTQLPQATKNALPTTGVQPELQRDNLKLVPIKPIKEALITSIAETSPITTHFSKTGQSTSPRLSAYAKTEIFSDSFTDTFLGSLLSKVNYWKTAETAIQGFNYLTESQLSIGKTTDEDGKLTGFLVGMESYAISGNKIK